MSYTEDGLALLEALVGESQVTYQMRMALERAEQTIHRKGVRLIRAEEVEAALTDAGIEIPNREDAEPIPEEKADQPPIVVDWSKVAAKTPVKFQDERKDIYAGIFMGINEDGTLKLTTKNDDGKTARLNVPAEDVGLVPGT